MAENRQQPPEIDRPKDPEGRHERSDINIRAITKFGIAFVVLGILMQFVVWYVFDLFRGRELGKKPVPAPRLDVDARKLPPEPRLQAAPTTDLKQMLTAEDEILSGYAWVDRDRGLVRIPVARAMDLIAREGLPARSGAGPQSQSTATVPRESGLGPIIHQAGGPLSPNRTFPPDLPLETHGNGNPFDGRAAAGPPTPPDRSLANTEPAAAEAPPIAPSGTAQHGAASSAGPLPAGTPSSPAGGGHIPGTPHHGGPEQQQKK